ncbi:hypothetical protein OG943_16915 [Amycolatopsis sp. NBC_00345]
MKDLILVYGSASGELVDAQGLTAPVLARRPAGAGVVIRPMPGTDDL